MTTKTIYLPTVYVDETTGEIIEKEQLKNLSYKSKLITNIEKNGTTKKIHSIREITITIGADKSTLIKYEAVEDTHFTLVQRENEVLITIGNQVCDANVFENKTEAKKYINKKPWMLIATTSLILSQNVNKGGKE